MKEIVSLTLSLIKSAILDTKISEEERSSLTQEKIKKLYDFSKFLDISQVIGHALIKENLIDGEMKQLFNKEIFVSVMRVEKNNFAISQIKEILIKENIDFILLKGAVVRPMYPQQFLRTSADIDVFLREKDFEKNLKTITSKYGLKLMGRTPHDCTILAENGTHIELHFSVKDDNYLKNADSVVKKIWDYTIKEKDTCEHKLTNEYFAFYHLVHLSKHVQSGGCGVKPFIDNYFIEKLDINRQIFGEMLKQSKLEKMYQTSIAFTNYIFNETQADDKLLLFIDFCMSGGVFGTIYNFVSVNQARAGGKGRYILSRIFMPYRLLKKQYPKLEKRKWLLPYYQLVRWKKMIFSGRLKNTITEVKTNNNTSSSNQNKVKELFEYLEIK